MGGAFEGRTLYRWDLLILLDKLSTHAIVQVASQARKSRFINMASKSSNNCHTEIFNYETATHSYAIHWSTLGDSASPPLIFVHGTPWSSRVWIPFALSLARKFHVYLFDNPGFGESPLGLPLPGKEDTITKMVALDADLSQQSEVFAA